MGNDLLNSIIRCDEIAKSSSDPCHACNKIVSVQRGLGGGSAYQVPEPWRGDLKRAPLLFISSNPSIDLLDDAPWSTQSTSEIADYYDGPEKRISKQFPHSTYRYGPKSRRPVKFWDSVHRLAVELYGTEEISSGRHYAITEVVHCKSQREYGVSEALSRCADKFLGPLLTYSGFKFIVCLGDQAESSIDRLVRGGFAKPLQMLCLAHPCAWGSHKVDPGDSTGSANPKKKKRLSKARTVEAAIEKRQYTTAARDEIRKVLNDARSLLHS